ncbi:MAG: hypothetical protein ACRYGP_02645 [Janthinobacterium lividum]
MTPDKSNALLTRDAVAAALTTAGYAISAATLDRGHIDWSPTYRCEVRETLEHGLVRLSFNEWEREFITSIITRLRDPRGRLTFRQAEVVDRLVAKIEGRR